MPRDGQLGGTADGAHDAMSVHGLAGGKQMPGDERRRSAESLNPVGGAGVQGTPRRRERTRRDHRARARARTRAPSPPATAPRRRAPRAPRLRRRRARGRRARQRRRAYLRARGRRRRTEPRASALRCARGAPPGRPRPRPPLRSQSAPRRTASSMKSGLPSLRRRTSEASPAKPTFESQAAVSSAPSRRSGMTRASRASFPTRSPISRRSTSSFSRAGPDAGWGWIRLPCAPLALDRTAAGLSEGVGSCRPDSDGDSWRLQPPICGGRRKRDRDHSAGQSQCDRESRCRCGRPRAAGGAGCERRRWHREGSNTPTGAACAQAPSRGANTGGSRYRALNIVAATSIQDARRRMEASDERCFSRSSTTSTAAQSS